MRVATMITTLATLILLTTASLTQTNEVPHQIPLKVVEVGGNVTLHCPVSKNGGNFFYWYKQPLGHRNKQRLTHVRQTPETTSVQEGDTVTLQCSLLPKSKESSSHCPSDYNVYWFRVGFGESHPSIIYTHKNSNDAQNRSCAYQLYRTIQNSSDTGIYYCAVVTCGKILFGEGTKVETRKHFGPVVIVLSVLLGLCVIVIAVLIFSRD
ncbi:hypothetical protein AMECASPLE_030839 [Ameca splendens]|uniref:Ig-like domain-containing protein n=1 Tax=Ameca splendens TaxID=208324 RepID=A0ABV0ZFZ5_9TELE